jgi:hypothetical protein
VKSVNEIRTSLMGEYNTRQPDLDLSEGTPERDIFIEAPISGSLTNLWDNEDYVSKLFAPIKYYQEINDGDIEAYCANFDITRRAAIFSTGIVVFYTNTKPSADIVISSGTLVSTVSTPQLSFSVITDFVAPLTNITSYYNALTLRYEFSLTVQATVASSTYRAGALTVTVLNTSIPGIQGCINTNSISGGGDAETNQSMLQRTLARFQSRGLNNDLGIKSYVENYTVSAYIASAGDPLMLRDEGHGGMIDVYIEDVTLAGYQERFTITAEGLAQTITSNYTTKSLTLSKPPVYSITSITINNVGTPIAYYTLVKDLGILTKSMSAQDKFVLTSTGISNLGEFKVGDNILVNYDYNSLAYSINTNLTTSTNKYLLRDYLVREMTAAPIKIEMTLTPITGATIETYQSSWNSIISTYITSLSSGSTVTIANILSTYNSISTIANINLPSIVLTDVNGLGINSSGNLVFPNNVYPVFDTAIYTPWMI